MRQSEMKLEQRRRPSPQRRGAFLAMGVAGLVVSFVFVSFSVDIGLISLTRARMQNAVDAAALAAAQEISLTIREIGEQYAGDGEVDPIQVSEERAREVAIEVAALNDVYVTPSDVEFGKRIQDDNGNYEIHWGATPYNVVRVTARREDPDTSQPDGQLSLFFAGVFGDDSASLRTKATSFVEARDLGLVLDFSASMNDDSEVRAYDRLGKEAVVANQQEIYDILNIEDGDLTRDPQFYRLEGADPVNGSQPKIFVTFKDREVFVESSKDLSNVVMVYENGVHQKFDDLNIGQTGTFSGTGSNRNRHISRVYVKSGANNESGEGPGYGERFDISIDLIKQHFGLEGLAWPYDGGSWSGYVNYAMKDSEIRGAGVAYEFGGPTLVNYLIRAYPEFHNTHDLWKVPAQPVNALKNGVKLFVDYLNELQFSDHVGIVTYCDDAYLETVLDHPSFDVSVNLGSSAITDRYDDIYQIVKHKQAGHYSRNTGMGYGVEKGITLLEQAGRVGTKRTILIMTDGLANRSPNNFSLPTNWNWNKLTDYDKDGVADYITNDRDKQFAFYHVKDAIDKGYTVHTITVGAGADRDLMRAISHAGGGVWADVPGGSTIDETQEQMLAAFATIASHVPPPRLIDDQE